MYGEPVTLDGSDLLARCVQHETDHLDGVLFVDRLDPETRREAMARDPRRGVGRRRAGGPAQPAPDPRAGALKLVFAGTPAVALPSLRALLGSRHEVVAVVTRPDAPGRPRPARSPVAGRAAGRRTPASRC